MTKKLTPWFPGDVKPAHQGVYERNDEWTSMYDGHPNYSFWNGRYWELSSQRINHPDSGLMSGEQELPWRGLANKPTSKP